MVGCVFGVVEYLVGLVKNGLAKNVQILWTILKVYFNVDFMRDIMQVKEFIQKKKNSLYDDVFSLKVLLPQWNDNKHLPNQIYSYDNV